MKGLRALLELTALSVHFSPVVSIPNAQEQLLITIPPVPRSSSCPNANPLKRQESCRFGYCGGDCLSQGAFCCGPAGTLISSPKWVCDNGACITSVRGMSGIVDCFDPDNPGGTTQSCIDNVPTTTCKPTDRCYTCNTDQPYCRWETFIDLQSVELSWFSCVETKLPDMTFEAATLTTNDPSPSRLPSGSRTTSLSSTTATSAPESNEVDDDSPLSTGAIIGIAVGGGVVLIIGAILVFCCLRQRKQKVSPPPELSGNPAGPPMSHQAPMELDTEGYSRNELNTTAGYSSYNQSAVSPPDDHAGHGQERYMWRQGSQVAPAELQAQKTDYIVQPPRELHGDTAEQRGIWGQGYDQLRHDQAHGHDHTHTYDYNQGYERTHGGSEMWF